MRAGGWAVEVRKGPMVSSAEAEALQKRLLAPLLPEMVFCRSGVVVQHEESGLRLELAAADALQEWDHARSAGVQVPAARTWSKRLPAGAPAAGEAQGLMYGSVAAPESFDWTFTTLYGGSLGPRGVAVPAPEGTALDVARLQRRDPIRLLDELTLFEDELADNGVAALTVRLRATDGYVYVLLRYFLRVDDVLIRIHDTRFFIDLAAPPATPPRILRERIYREASYEWLDKNHRRPSDPTLFANPDHFAQFLPVTFHALDFCLP